MDKNSLIRSLVTKIATNKEFPELKYDSSFYDEYENLIHFLEARKNDLPGLDTLTDKYYFIPTDNDFTFTDIFDQLNKLYFDEQITIIVKNLIQESKLKDREENSLTNDLDKLTKEFGKLRNTLTNAFDIDISKDTEKIAEEYRRYISKESLVKLGITEFDDSVKPKLGQLIMLLGPTKSGKTQVAVKMLTELIKAGTPSIYISLEMNVVEIINRILVNLGIFKFRDLFDGIIPENEYLNSLQNLQSECNIVTRQNSKGKIDIKTIEKLIQEKKPKVLFIDHCLLLDNDVNWDSKDNITANLKRLALTYEVLILALWQADSEAVKHGEMPRLNNLARNKSAAWDCDAVLAMVMQRFEGDNKLRMHFDTIASRNGGMATFSYKIDPNQGIWEDVTLEVAAGIKL